MGGRDHACETCGKGGMNDPDGECVCMPDLPEEAVEARLVGKQATVRLPECASEQGEPKTEIPFTWGFRAELGPTLAELREKALRELRKAGIEHHGRDLLPDADSPSPEKWRLVPRTSSDIEHDFDLRANPDLSVAGSEPRAGMQNRRGEWVPAIPLPFYGVRKKCRCGAKFWTMDGYRGHYALRHIVDPEASDV